MPLKLSPIEIAQQWKGRIEAANRVYKCWADRFKVDTLYQYYEGYQWEDAADDIMPYIVNLIYSNIESKLPNMLFQNPEFNMKARPYGEEYNPDEANQIVVTKNDIVNYVARRKEFNLAEKHELCALDAFFGFAVMHIDYDNTLLSNPYLPSQAQGNPLNALYAKHVPFDRFRVSARANWDLSEGKWYGFYEYVPYERLEKYADKIPHSNLTMDENDEAAQYAASGIIKTGETATEITPSNCAKIWYIWDFETMTKMTVCMESKAEDMLLEKEEFQHSNVSTLRYGKRRRGWYPLPPVFQWISPQDEINDIHQAMRIHRKRFKRKYLMQGDSMEPEEEQKLLYGPDGTIVKVNKLDNVKPLEDPPMDAAAANSMLVSYDDFNRVAGSTMEQGRIQDRTTASQANINERRAQVRESKELNRMANFLVDIGYSIERCLRKAKNPFWAEVSLNNEQLLGAIQHVRTRWTRVSPGYFENDDYELDVKVSSVSPIYQDQDKKAFMEFLAMITQYEMLSFSPALIREAADKVGYRNSTVLNQLQQWAQLLAIGRSVQLQAQAAPQAVAEAPNPQEPGELAQRQVAESTPGGQEEIMSQIFNRGGLQ